jgi:hypothetical protein
LYPYVGPLLEVDRKHNQGEAMDEPKVKYADLFNPKPVGEKVKTHVHRVAPEEEPDYEALQRLIKSWVPTTKPKE